MALVVVARTILLRCKEPFGDEQGLVRKLAQTIEEIAGNAAVWHIHIVIGRDYVHVGCHMAYGIRIIVNLLTITKNQRLGIRLADGAMHQSIVLFGYHARPASEHPDTLAPRAEICSDIAALDECL